MVAGIIWFLKYLQILNGFLQYAVDSSFLESSF